MAFTTDHGIVELMSTWQFVPSSGPSPPPINDHGDSWIKLESAPGLHDAPEADDNRDPRTIEDGEIIYPGFKLGRTFSLKASVYANNEDEMYTLLTGVRRGYTTNMVDEGRFTITPYSGIGGPVWNLDARVLGFHPDDTFTWNLNQKFAYRWGFELVFRQSDPLFYSDDTAYI